MTFKKLDHIAIVVANTDEALKLYRDVLGLPVRFSQVLEDQNVRLTHLDMGNADLQLVEPLVDDHPLQKALAERGEHLHHFCFYVDSVEEMIATTLPSMGVPSRDAQPRSGPNGRQAAFIDPANTHNVLIEITSDTES